MVDRWYRILMDGLTDVEWHSTTWGNYSPRPWVGKSTVRQPLCNSWPMVTGCLMTLTRMGARHRTSTPSLWSAAVSPPPSDCTSLSIHDRQDRIGQPLSDALHILAGKLFKALGRWALDNHQLTISSPTTLGCRLLMDSDFICLVLEHPVDRNKISFPSEKSDNPWGHPWASMIVSQPLVNHQRASLATVKYKIFNQITHHPWASMSVRIFCGEAALLQTDWQADQGEVC